MTTWRQHRRHGVTFFTRPGIRGEDTIQSGNFNEGWWLHWTDEFYHHRKEFRTPKDAMDYRETVKP